MSDVMPSRPLSRRETAAITKLVQAAPPEFAPLLAQLPRATVTARCACGCATIDISVPSECPRAADGFTGLLPTEGTVPRGASPADGLIVFLRDGLVTGLEVYGVADEPLRELPPAQEIIVLPVSDAR